MKNKILINLKKDSHPYLMLLYNNIMNYGFKILDARSYYTMNFHLKSLMADTIHFHWIEYIIEPNRNLLRVFSNSINYYLKIINKMNKNTVVTMHNIVPHEYENIGRIINKLSNILNNFSYIIVHNKYSYNKLLSTYGNHLSSKTVIIPHGSFSLYYNTSYNLNDIKLFRQQYNIPEDAFVYGFFGSIRMYKGVDLLVEAFNRISKNYNDVYLLVCGNDNNRILEKYKYNNSCSKCIFRLEYIPDDRVRSCIIPFDVAVVPYRVVYTPGSAILYASFKKPIITSRIPVMLETLDGNAIYHAPEDLDSLVEAMIYAYEDRDKLNVLAERAFNAVERYSWREIAMSTIKLYNGLDS